MTSSRSSRRAAVTGPVGALPASEAANASEVDAIHAYCAVYTKPEVARAVLDGLGWTASSDLRARRLLEPAAGDGAFLIPAIERLVESARRHGFCTESELSNSIVAYEFEPGTATALRARVRRALSAAGVSGPPCERLASAWVRCEDFLTASLAAKFTDIVGNPPYMRWSKLPKGLRKTYEETLAAHAAKGDLCLAFICKAADLLGPVPDRIAFLCADRWLKCAYGEAARGVLRERVRVVSHVEAHGLPVFAGTRKVTAYAAVTVLDADPEGGGRVVKPADLTAFLRAVREPGRPGSRAASRRLLRSDGGALIGMAAVQDLLAAIIKRHPTVGAAGVQVRCGMALGCAPAFIVDPSTEIEPERLVAFVRSQDLATDGSTAPSKLLVNVWREDGELVDLTEWPRLADHLAPWRAKLSRRACVGQDSPWHRTIDRLHADRSANRVLVAGMARRSRVAMARAGEQPSNALYVLESRDWPTPALFALLRSGFLDVFAEALAPTFSGASRRFDGNLLRQVRIPLWSTVASNTRKALEDVDVVRAIARPGLICDVLRLPAATHRKTLAGILGGVWGDDIA